MSAPLDGWVERFPSVRLAVAGDFIADEFIYGDTSRIRELMENIAQRVIPQFR